MRHQYGVSLIEILMSFFIISVMLLGFDAMQITILREAKSAYYFAVAAEQLDVMAEYLDSIKNNGKIDEQVAIWNEQNHEVLPQGRGEISGHYPDLILSIFWGDKSQSMCDKNRMGLSGCLRISITH